MHMTFGAIFRKFTFKKAAVRVIIVLTAVLYLEVI